MFFVLSIIYHMESASTAISAFFRYPVSNTSNLKYQFSKLPMSKFDHWMLMARTKTTTKKCS